MIRDRLGSYSCPETGHDDAIDHLLTTEVDLDPVGEDIGAVVHPAAASASLEARATAVNERGGGVGRAEAEPDAC